MDKKNNRSFIWLGKIVYKIESSKFATQIGWHTNAKKEWNRILFLNNIKKISIPDTMVSNILNLKENFRYSYTVIKDIGEGEMNKLLALAKYSLISRAL